MPSTNSDSIGAIHQEARERGLRWSDVHDAYRQIKAREQEKRERANEVRKTAWELAKAHSPGCWPFWRDGFQSTYRTRINGGADFTIIPRYDEIASEIAGQFPEYATDDGTQRLWDFLLSRYDKLPDRITLLRDAMDVVEQYSDIRRNPIKRRVNGTNGRKPKPVETEPDPEPVEPKMPEVVHPAFHRVLQLAQARKHIFLPGPSGSGKSHLAGQVAEALGLRFGTISCSAGMSESQLLGRMVPHGAHGQFEFLTTEFLGCYENGGVFLFDELDAADANVLLVVNSALANGRLSVPSRHDQPVSERHRDFVCIAAANTWGRGADRQYCGRNELDEATLDRFRIGIVPMDYDEDLERKLCPNAELFERLRNYRARAQANRLERIVSTRFMVDAFEMVERFGWSFDQVDAQLFTGWRDDEVRKVKGA